MFKLLRYYSVAVHGSSLSREEVPGFTGRFSIQGIVDLSERSTSIPREPQ